MRRRGLGGAAALVAVALVAAGCGGSSGGSGGTAGGSASADASASPSSKPMTKAQAKAAAKAINLKRADLPGYRASRSSDQGASDAHVQKCVGGVPSSKDIVDIDSPDFATGSGGQVREVSSTVTVLPSAQLAAKDLAAARTERARTCLQRFLTKELARSTTGQVTFGNARVTPFHPDTAGTDGAFGYRIGVVAKGRGAHVPFSIVMIGFTEGPIEVSLSTLGIGHPYPAAELKRLYGVLVDRARGRKA